MKKIIIYALSTYSVIFTNDAFADIYKCTGDGGAPTFVDGSTKSNYKNCQVIMRDNGAKAQPNKEVIATPSNFPRVDKQTQSQRDDKRKQILLFELDTEKKAVASAKAQGASSELAMHQKNIELLQKEVSALK